MANFSFDVSTGCDLQEVDNAVNQARKEIFQRYDFKGVKVELELDREAGVVSVDADDAYRLSAATEVLKGRMAARKVPLKNLHYDDVEQGGGGRARQTIRLQQGIPDDTAKKISKELRGLGLKKLQAQIQGDELRVSSPSKDTLQEAMNFLRGEDWGVELNFGNFR
jgi:hypothetical protein